MHPTSGSGCVQLAGRTVHLAWLREHTPQAHGTPLFARARAEVGHACCLCRSPALRLVIRCTRAGRYHLALARGRRPARDHLPLPQARPRTLRPRPLQHAGHQGGRRRRVPPPRHPSRPQPGPPRNPPERDGRAPDDRHARRTIGLLGLLHWLWEEARLNTWQPGLRHQTWRHCHALLHRHLREATVNDQGLDSVRYLVPPFTPQAAANTAAWKRSATGWDATAPPNDAACSWARSKRSPPTPYGVAYRLAHQRTPLYPRGPARAGHTLLPARLRQDGRERRKAAKWEFYQRQQARPIEWDITRPLPDLTCGGTIAERRA